MPHWLEYPEGQEFFTKVFEAAGLPEVDEKDLEPGTYTNRQIAEKVVSPEDLLFMLMGLLGGCQASKRSILSFMVDMG